MEACTSKIRVYIFPYAGCLENSPLIHLYVYKISLKLMVHAEKIAIVGVLSKMATIWKIVLVLSSKLSALGKFSLMDKMFRIV